MLDMFLSREDIMKNYDHYMQTDEAEIRDLVENSPMGLLLTQEGERLQSGMFNAVWHEGRLYLHLNRSDEQFKALKKNPKARMIFFDFLCHIPSHWVDAHYGGAATSYYRFADMTCDAKIYTDLEDVARVCQIFLDQFQPGGGYASLQENPEVYLSSYKILGIVELIPTQTLAKWKIGQNRSVKMRNQIAEKLRSRAQSQDLRAAHEVEKWIQQKSL